MAFCSGCRARAKRRWWRAVALGMLLAGAPACSLVAPKPQRDRVIWRRPIVSPGTELAGWHGIPATDGRYVYIQTDTGVSAIDPADGHVVWAVGLWRARWPVAESIAWRQGLLLFSDRDAAWALAADDGRLVWKRSFGADSLHQLSFLGADDRNVYVTQRFEPFVTAARQRDGAVVWQRMIIPDSGFFSVVTGMGRSGDTLYFGGARSHAVNGYPKSFVVVGVSADAGAPLLQFEKSTPNTGATDDMVVQDSLLILGDFLGSSILAINRFTNTKVWEVFGDPTHFGPDYGPQLIGDTAFIASNDDFVYAVGSRSGALYWKRGTGGSISRFALCGRFVLANNQAIVVIDRGSHQIEGRYLTEESDFPTSGFAVVGMRAVATGTKSVYGIDCS